MGKTMLSIFITESLEESNERVTYFFCRHDDEKRNTEPQFFGVSFSDSFKPSQTNHSISTCGQAFTPIRLPITLSRDRRPFGTSSKHCSRHGTHSRPSVSLMDWTSAIRMRHADSPKGSMVFSQ